MNMAQLRAFHAVAVEGSFTGAARALHITQPTVSGHVAALERHWGVALVAREGRQVRLTPTGERLEQLAARLFAVETEAEALLGATVVLGGGHLRIGADCPQHVSEIVARLHHAHPGLSLSLTTGSATEVLADLLGHRTDVAVVADPGPTDRLVLTPLRTSMLRACVSADHPWTARATVPLSALTEVGLVGREEGSVTRRCLESAAAGAGLSLATAVEADSREAAWELVASGVGVGVVSEHEISPDPRVLTVPITGCDVSMTQHLACLRERRHHPAVDAFCHLALEVAAGWQRVSMGRPQGP